MSAVASRLPHPVASCAFWRDYLVTCRLYLSFVSGTAGLVGLALVPSLPPGKLACAVPAFLLSYGFGQALTDVFQTDTDSLSAPYRPLVQGHIAKGQVAAVSLAGLAICAVLLVLCNPWTLIVSGLGVVGLATYTPWKRRWWGGPPWNSWIVACLPLIGVQCGVPGFAAAFAVAGLGWAVASAFFSYATFVLLGYFKDVSADRATGYETLVVRFGWRPALLVSAGNGLLAVAASAALVRGRGAFGPGLAVAGGVALIAWVAGVSLLAVSHVAMGSRHAEDRAYGPIELCVRGYVLLHLGEACLVRPSLSMLAIAFYAGLELALALRPERRQV